MKGVSLSEVTLVIGVDLFNVRLNLGVEFDSLGLRVIVFRCCVVGVIDVIVNDGAFGVKSDDSCL
jgi:hypothetical protein